MLATSAGLYVLAFGIPGGRGCDQASLEFDGGTDTSPFKILFRFLNSGLEIHFMIVFRFATSLDVTVGYEDDVRFATGKHSVGRLLHLAVIGVENEFV